MDHFLGIIYPKSSVNCEFALSQNGSISELLKKMYGSLCVTVNIKCHKFAILKLKCKYLKNVYKLSTEINVI